MKPRNTSFAIGIGSTAPSSRRLRAIGIGQAYRISLALAEWLCRTADRIDPARVRRPYRRHRARRICARILQAVCSLLQRQSERTGHWTRTRRQSRPVQWHRNHLAHMLILGGLHHHYVRV